MPDEEFETTLADFADTLFSPTETAAPAADEAPTSPQPAPEPVAEENVDLSSFLEPSTPMASPVISAPVTASETDGSLEAFMTDMGIRPERDVPNIIKPWMKYHKFERVTTVEEVRALVDAALKSGRCALDTETQGLDTRITYDGLGNPRTVHQIVGFCLSVDGEAGYYIPIRHAPDDGGEDLNVKPLAEVEAEIKRLCVAAQPIPTDVGLAKDPLSFKREFFAKPPEVIIYFCNAKFDQEMLYPVTGIDWWHPDSFEDCQLAFFCHYSADKALGLKHKSAEHLRALDNSPYTMIELKELFIKGVPIKFASLSPDEPGVVRYGCSDAICTFLLCEPPRKHEKDRLDIMHLAHTRYDFTYRLEKQVVQAVRTMERYRVRINRARAKELLDHYRTERERILGEINKFTTDRNLSHLDPNSPKQLSDFLFGDGPGCLNITPKPEKNELSGQYKTDGETLETMVKENPHAPPILKWIVDFRAMEKMIGTYLEHLFHNPDKKDELRFNFKQTGTGTGRFSAPAEDNEQGFSGVPVHGIPGESAMRKLFMAREGYTAVKCDYAGQELRIASNVSGEPVWIKEFLEGDGDLHSITARAFFNKDTVSKDERKMGKIANFALIYGGGPAAIIRATGCDKLEASRRKQAFDKAVPTFAKWIKIQQAAVKKQLGVWTPFKRWLAIPDANHPDRKVQAACERYAVNYPIQGSGADIMKISMVMLHKEFYKRGWLKTGNGDDSVRMLLTVHDEIVFEIRHDRVTEAVPIIVDIMELPARMAAPPWIVPLITEPLVGPNWGTGYKCERATSDYKLKEGEHLINGFVYGTVRVVDLGKDRPEDGEEEAFRNTEKKQVGIRIIDPAWIRESKGDDVSGPAVPAASASATPAPATPANAGTPSNDPPAPAPTTSQESPPAPTPAQPAAPKGRIVCVRINSRMPHTVEQVRMACSKAYDPEGQVLKLMDRTWQVLVDPSWNVTVDVKKLTAALLEMNLSNGKYSEEA